MADRDRFPRGLREMAVNSRHASQTVFLEECAQMLEGLHGCVDRYRYVGNYAGADSWDCGPELIARLQWAKGADVDGELADNRVAELGQEFYACTARASREPGSKPEIVLAIEAFRDAFAPPDEDFPAHSTEQWAAIERLEAALVAAGVPPVERGEADGETR